MTFEDHDAVSNASGDPNKAAHGEAKVRSYLEMGSKSSGSAHGARMFRTDDRSPVVKVSYSNSCDLDRLQKFRSFVKDLASVRKLSRVFGFIFAAVPEFIPCQ